MMTKDVEFDCSHCGEHLIFKNVEGGGIPELCLRCGMSRSHRTGSSKPHKIIKGEMWLPCHEPSCKSRLKVKDIPTQDVNKDGADWQSYWKYGKRFGKKR